MQKLKALYTIIIWMTLGMGAANEDSIQRSLRSFADQLGVALCNGDWKSFRKLATPYIAIEEHWNAYDDYFDDSFKKSKGMVGLLGWHANKSIEYRTVIQNAADLPANHRRLFKSFCKEVRDSKDYAAARPDWLDVRAVYGKHIADSFPVATPHLYATVASNEDIIVEVVDTDSGWRAQRLMVVGH